MNWNGVKKGLGGAGLMAALLVGPASVFTTTAMAQDHDRDDHRGDRNWRRDHDHDRNWHRDGDRDRDRDRDWYRGRRGYVYVPPRVYTYPRTYPYGGYYGGPYGGYGGYGGYGNYGGGNFGYWEQKGYRDGLDRGREDARSGRYPTPNNSEHFRNGNAAYRQGFARGYQIGFRQYGGGYGRF